MRSTISQVFSASQVLVALRCVNTLKDDCSIFVLIVCIMLAKYSLMARRALRVIKLCKRGAENIHLNILLAVQGVAG